MSVASADLHAAIHAAWDAADLDNEFQGYWPAADQAEFAALYDTEAAPNQPFPYCVYSQGEGNTTARMSGVGPTGRYEIRDVPWQFKIYARQTTTTAGKDVAAALAGAVLAAFGGHPTIAPDPPVLANGEALIAQYQGDFGMPVGDDEYMWTINYIFRLDAPVAA